ncbi:MAG: acyltransferase [Hellea sp.]|nr:acyltransferase [Hellea sp.]
MFSSVKIRDGHDNFFTPIRLLFALMVLVGHAFVIVMGGSENEPAIFFHYRPSYLAVNLFFIASGFLVTKSMLYREDLVEYGSARTLRIFPALIVHVLFVMFAIGPFVTNVPLTQFFTDPQFWTQPFRVLTFADTDMTMPGAFASNHEQIGSGALWTLRYEVLAYIGTAGAFSLGLLRRKWMLIMQFILFMAAWPIAHLTGVYDQLPATLQAILRFGLAYGLGAAIYALRDRLTFHIGGVFILGLIASLFGYPYLNYLENGTMTVAASLFEIMTTLWLGYIVFWMAYVKLPALNGLKKLSDTSYGIYIYHWVVLQTAIFFIPGLEIWQLIAIALPVSVALALASWHIVEKPMLRSKGKLSRYIKRKFGKSKDQIPAPAE